MTINLAMHYIWQQDLEFQNLKINPTVILASKCVTKSKIPIIVFPNILIPTVPIINKGPELLVKLKSLSHSSLEQMQFWRQ